jgi:transposase
MELRHQESGAVMEWKRGRSYSQDLRERVIAAAACASIRSVADRFGVSPAYVPKAAARARETGERAARAQRSHQTPVLEPYREALTALELPWKSGEPLALGYAAASKSHGLL